ncbi:electron transfer flavoprotein-ubiquinone oxidoreductase [Gammaproteobacteria bacterium]|nr:electron transfer flavoprotein-ubiquinone oxidoreductase [Gammaproteobacteria bacterium]
MNNRESIEFDILIIGAGPAGLSAAIRLAQINTNLSICIIDKANDIGEQILSGAVIEIKALDELLPNWKNLNAPITTKVTSDKFLFLSKNKSFKLPTPKSMNNIGNYIISLGKLCKWLATQAENLGINIFPSFAATEIIYKENTVCGVITGDKGLDNKNSPTKNYQPGINIYAKQTFFAEGCRGSLTETLFTRYQLKKSCDPQTYGLGIKELWEIPENEKLLGSVIHTIGWPLKNKTYGGSFIYHFDKNYLATGFVVGLDYENTYLNPYEEFQRFKLHPQIKSFFSDGERISYGAKTLNEGGLQSIPKLTFPGGLIIGCAAGFLNVPKIKGIHNAMKSGMIAAESVTQQFNNYKNNEYINYQSNLNKSWVYKELYKVRNIRPAMAWGLIKGLVYSVFDTYILRGNAPWTLSNYADYTKIKRASMCDKIIYPEHDNKVSFDLMSSVFLSQIQYNENQPCHLKILNTELTIKENFEKYDSPEQRYCPAGVYEIVFYKDNNPNLQINYTNCIHCKACDIKDPLQNIIWTPPEGGNGPQYNLM